MRDQLRALVQRDRVTVLPQDHVDLVGDRRPLGVVDGDRQLVDHRLDLGNVGVAEVAVRPVPYSCCTPRNGNGVPIHENAIISNSPAVSVLPNSCTGDVDDLDLDADLGELALQKLRLVLRHRHADELREADGQRLTVLLAHAVAVGSTQPFSSSSAIAASGL